MLPFLFILQNSKVFYPAICVSIISVHLGYVYSLLVSLIIIKIILKMTIYIPFPTQTQELSCRFICFLVSHWENNVKEVWALGVFPEWLCMRSVATLNSDSEFHSLY